MIDFGFLCTNISCKDGSKVILGYHPFIAEDDLNLCNKRQIDIILFIAWLLRFNKKVLARLDGVSDIDLTKQLLFILQSRQASLQNYL